jgi:hypothetical protein
MTEKSRYDLINEALEAHKTKDFKIMFFVPESGNIAGGSIYEIYHNARTLKENGYDVANREVCRIFYNNLNQVIRCAN